MRAAKRLSAAELDRVHAEADADDPLVRLAAAAKLLQHWGYLTEESVRLARRQGYSWTDIGDALGISRQAAWERFRPLGPP